MAPPHGTAAANPNRLAAYSDASTHAAQNLQGWLRGVLEPALDAYLQGAATRSDGTNIDLRAVHALLGAVRSDLPRHVATVYYTDRDVHRVGTLFAEAGRAGHLPVTSMSPTGSSGLLDSVVHTDDRTLDAMAVKDGAALATSLDPHNLPPGKSLTDMYLSRLAEHADDALFCAGFFGATGYERLLQLGLPWNAVTKQALVSALRSGALGDKAVGDLVSYLQARPGNPNPDPSVFSAVAADPQAAARLTAYLLGNGARLKALLSAPTAFSQSVLRMLTSAESTMSVEETQRLLKVLGSNLPPMSLREEQARAGDLGAFLTMGANRLLGLLPAHDPKNSYRITLVGWADCYGDMLDKAVRPYEMWLERIYEENKRSHQEARDLVENFAAGVASAPINNPLLAGAFGATFGYVEGRAIDPALADKWSLGPDSPRTALDPRNFLRQAAFLNLITKVYAGSGAENGLPAGSRQDAGLQHVLRLAAAGKPLDERAHKWIAGNGNGLQRALTLVGNGGKPDMDPVAYQWLIGHPLPIAPDGNFEDLLHGLGSNYG